MKRIACIVAVVCMVVTACSKKDSFITSADALLRTSVDTLHYDTVFTSTGSVTQSFKIFNPNNQKLLLTNLQLMGGTASLFKMNVDGIPGAGFTNVEIEANDSLYVFVLVNINPNGSTLPFIVQDSIRIDYNGNTRFVQLEAYGQNAHFMRNKRVTKDSTWKNDLPYVILGSLSVDPAATLTIEKGCKVYVHADAPIAVNGTLKANGTVTEKIQFAGDRLDEPYKDYPGSWPGIYFGSTSKDNLLQHAVVKNAYQGVIAVNPSVNANPKLTLRECIVDNVYDIAVGGNNSSISATNCLISNCGYNVYLANGGTYDFNYCTIASYQNAYLDHKYSVLTISNKVSSGTANTLNCTVKNSIVYGEGGLADNEITIAKDATATFNAAFENVLYRMKDNADPANAVFSGVKLKTDPLFDSVNTGTRYFNFRLKNTSPCLGKGGLPLPATDLNGNARVNSADLGCYEQ